LNSLSSAISDFRAARNQAALKEILARLRGDNIDLLSYDDVLKMLKVQGSSERGLRDIPLDSIVGSVGRYSDFTRDFLPRENTNAERWARVKIAMSDMAGLPPIEVYQIGDVYFVKDGNHRVSVARQIGATHIQAYVTEVRTRVPLTPDTKPDDLIVKAEYADFLEKTHLDELRPDVDLSVTVPGQYEKLLEHIEVHRYYMGIDFQRDIPYQEAVTHWVDAVYLPVVRIIRERGMLQYFPNRTEADLYLWIADHRATLEHDLGWQVVPAAAASDLVSQQGAKEASLLSRLGGRVLNAVTLDALESGPPPGQWRRDREGIRREDRLFNEVLVPLSGEERGWYALEQAIVVARREDAMLYGLHVVPDGTNLDGEVQNALLSEFNQRCAQAGVAGKLVIAAGEVTQQIVSRSRWTDLVVVNLAYPPAPQPLGRLSSGFHDLVQRCPRPILATPQTTSPLSRALLAYDGSPKAEEALYVATYIAGQWKTELRVVTVLDSARVTGETLDRARQYLEAHGVQADYLEEKGQAGGSILSACETQDCDLIIMGGYGSGAVREVVLGSSVDQVLRESHKPLLICR
jgi:nucleotide-binding universal stress UspA family protein